MTVPVFAPPHPIGVFEVLKTAFRAWAASGNAAGADIPTIAGQGAALPLAVSGNVYCAPMVPYPATVTVGIRQSGLKGPQTPAVNRTTGAFTTTIAGGVAGAGSATVEVSATSPAFVTNSNTFTLT